MHSPNDLTGPQPLTLIGQRVRLRQAVANDLPILLGILREPSVARVWSAPDDEADSRLLLGADPDGSEAITTFAITINDRVIGWIAGWEKLDPEYRHAGVDLFVSGEQQGMGYGREAIRLVCHWLFRARKHHRITIDPAASNLRAIAAYEKVGFRRVGVLRRYELGTDGTYHDGLLLDLLPEDLR